MLYLKILLHAIKPKFMKTKLLFTALLSLSLFVNAQYNEEIDGDFSNDHMNPTPITIVPSREIEILSTQNGDPMDVDYFTFNIPDGSELIHIYIDDFIPNNPNNTSSFIGIQAGTSFTTDENSTTAPDLLGGTNIGISDLSFSVVPSMGNLFGAIGFSGPLPAGDYTIWLDETFEKSFSKLTFFAQPVSNPSIIWEEEENDDLSDDHTSPTGVFKLKDAGMYELDIEQQGSPRDVEYFSFEIPAGKALSQIKLSKYEVLNPNNLSFIGIVSGDTFPNDADNTTAEDLLGGVTFGIEDLNNDILQDMGTLPGSIGFSGPLPSGRYSIWLNQTGEKSDTDIILVVTEETLSTSEVNIKNTTLVFPNPTLDKVTISAQNNIQSYTITDVSGRVVIPLKKVNALKAKVDVSSLSKGLYFATISTNKGSISKKIIKK